jgi:hypothetical protein
VRWVLREREESEGGAGGFLKPWRLGGTGQKKWEREGGHAGASASKEKEGEKGGPGMAVGSVGRPAAAPSHRVQGDTIAV